MFCYKPIDHIFTLTSIIRNCNDEHKPVFCAFIDLEKAFDRIDRELLMYRILQYNIDSRMYKAVRSLCTGTECCVKLRNDIFTEWFEVNNGVNRVKCLNVTKLK